MVILRFLFDLPIGHRVEVVWWLFIRMVAILIAICWMMVGW